MNEKVEDFYLAKKFTLQELFQTNSQDLGAEDAAISAVNAILAELTVPTDELKVLVTQWTRWLLCEHEKKIQNKIITEFKKAQLMEEFKEFVFRTHISFEEYSYLRKFRPNLVAATQNGGVTLEEIENTLEQDYSDRHPYSQHSGLYPPVE